MSDNTDTDDAETYRCAACGQRHDGDHDCPEGPGLDADYEIDNDHRQDDPVFIPGKVGIDAMNRTDGELCWRYNGLGRGWVARFNPETKYYEVAVQSNVPETTDDGDMLVTVKTKEHWRLGRMDMAEFWPGAWHARLEPVGLDDTPFPELGEPDELPSEVRRSAN